MPESPLITHIRFWLSALICLVWLSGKPADASEVFMEGAKITSSGPFWHIQPKLRWQVDPPVIEAIHSGVAVRFQIKGKLIKNIPVWPDTVFSRQSATIEVRYFSLSKQYLLKNINSGLQRGFLSLDNLWRHLGKIAELQLTSNPSANALALRLHLDTGALPAAMQLPTLFDTAWRLDTGWQEFSLPATNSREGDRP